VAKLNSQLNSMDQRTVTEDSLINYKNYFQYFLLLSLILLAIEMLISERVVKKQKATDNSLLIVNNSKLFLLLFTFICLSPVYLAAQSDNTIIKKGNEAYSKNEFDKAAVQYQKVISKTPNNATAHYNMGNALYKNSKGEEAINSYDNAATNLLDKQEKAKALYNKGVVLQNNKKLPECVEAYKNALKLNPQDDDARQNLQKALQQIKQQQKDNKEQKKPKEDPRQKDQQKQKEDEKNKQPKQEPSKITKKDAEEKLKALLQQEKNLQDKLKKVNVASPNKPEKDW
jgi:tetratricopeptide (TPR) repeat protein